jgi:hypothetical protein
VYEANREEPSDDTPESLKGVFWRGTVIGEAYQRDFMAENPGYQAEIEAPWGIRPDGEPIGIGHLDLGNPDTGKGIEVKTLLTRVPRHAYVQVTGYVRFLDYESAEIHAIDPVSGKVDVIPVQLAAFNPVVDAVLATIEECLRLQTLPTRVCANPAAWQARGCPFRTKCFFGWVGDDLADEELEAGSTAEVILASLMDLDLELKSAREHLKELEGTRDHLRTQVRDQITPNRWVTFGDGQYMVRVAEVKGSRSLPLGRLTEAGWDIPDALQDFVSEGKGYDKWSFKRR